MTEVLRDCVWPLVLQIAENHGIQPYGPLDSRAGTGKRTYHTIKINEATGEMSHRITFGKGMVQSKFSKYSALGWLSAQEILEKGYYAGEITLTNVLSHTILHEAAHALQRMAGERVKGEVHNPQFYQWLDRLSDVGAHLCHKALIDCCERRNLSLEFDSSEESVPEAIPREKIEKGEYYTAELTSGEYITALVTRINTKTVTARTDTGMVYRLPFRMIRKAAEKPVSTGLLKPDVAKPQKSERSENETGRFVGQYFFLSGDFVAPFRYQGKHFQSVVHLYAWLLAKSLKNEFAMKRLLKTEDPHSIKDVLNSMSDSVAALPEEIKAKALKRALWEKFANPVLQKRLVGTEPLALTHTDEEVHPDLGTQLTALRSYLIRNQAVDAG
jgi:hypothetical protein